MIGRLMAPAIEKMAAMDINRFIVSIVCAEHAMKNTIKTLKTELFIRSKRGGES